jgi:hypothetical protein
LGENIQTAEFGMISAETACWDIENSQIFNENFYLPLYLSPWYRRTELDQLERGMGLDKDHRG